MAICHSGIGSDLELTWAVKEACVARAVLSAGEAMGTAIDHYEQFVSPRLMLKNPLRQPLNHGHDDVAHNEQY